MSPSNLASLVARVTGADVAHVSDVLGEETARAFSSRTESELDALNLTPEQREKVAAMLEFARSAAFETMPRGATFRDGADVFRAFHARMRDLKLEQFWIVMLDGKHRVLREELVSQGTLTSSPVHPREVFAPAIRHSAAAIVLVHNHPSGDPAASADDLAITRRLCEVGAMVGICILDHVIVGDGTFFSLASRGLMPTGGR